MDPLDRRVALRIDLEALPIQDLRHQAQVGQRRAFRRSRMSPSPVLRQPFLERLEPGRRPVSVPRVRVPGFLAHAERPCSVVKRAQVSERAACKFVSVPIDGSIRTSGRRGKMRALIAFTRLLWKFPMSRTSRTVAVTHDHNKAALSKGQKAFNSAIRQIEKRRKRLRAWESVTPVFQQQYVNELLPLEQKSSALQIRMVHCLDRAYDRLTKAERRKVALVIVDLAGDLIGEGEGDDEGEGLKAIYDKYSPTSYDSEVATEVGEMKFMFESVFGVDLGDDLDLSSPEDLLQRAGAHFQQAQTEWDAQNAERDARRAKPKKSSRQQAAEARVQEQQAKINLSIREVYRKLASELHPDRETDPQERERKTQLMQRVNEAYQKNNLLQLLELQLELEHIDQHALNSMSEERLKHYNVVLKEQIRELDQEILHVESAFRHAYGIDPFEPVSPDTVLRNLAGDLKALQLNIQTLEQDLLAFEDLKNLKHWLKRCKLVSVAPDFDFTPF